MSEGLVKQYYTGQGVKEWERLSKHAYNRLEFDTTMHFLRKYLPGRGVFSTPAAAPGGTL